ncbi:MAG: DUF421 domain-containing protein [Pyrinomonadaceae bacterium]|nr:DUF421 domain-containing protein [Pyrinomonadaceae bacterium]
MFETILHTVTWLIGVEKVIAELTLAQMITRTAIVYGVALLLIRLGKRRFLGGYTAFDILMGFVVGSILSRAITGSENLYSTVVVILTLMAIHSIISFVTYKSQDFSKVIKNDERKLIEDGVVNNEAMNASKLGDNDLLQALRQQGGIETPEEVKSAFLERDGSITVIPKEKEPKVIEIKIEEGVQSVRVELA